MIITTTNNSCPKSNHVWWVGTSSTCIQHFALYKWVAFISKLSMNSTMRNTTLRSLARRSRRNGMETNIGSTMMFRSSSARGKMSPQKKMHRHRCKVLPNRVVPQHAEVGERETCAEKETVFHGYTYTFHWKKNDKIVGNKDIGMDQLSWLAAETMMKIMDTSYYHASHTA